MRTDIAIVGGGITGSSIAYHVSQRTDRSVTVFEREPTLAGGKTAASNAVFRMSGPERLREMKRYGLSLYNDLLASPAGDHGDDVLYERYDRLEVATTPEADDRLAAEAEAGDGQYLESAAIPETVILPELRTEAVLGGLYYPDAIRFDPRALAMEFVARARDNGASFETGTTVTDVYTDRSGVTGLETDAGEVEADVVVSAAGSHNARIAEAVGVDLPQRHDLGVLLRIEPRTSLGHSFPNLKHADSGVFYTGRADGTIVVGDSSGYGEAKQRDPDAVPDTVPPDVSDAIAETAELIAPALSMDRVDLREEWVGLACKTPDGFPIVGKTAVDGFAVAAYHSQGIQLAPAVGRIIAEQLVDGRPPTAYPSVSLSRFDGT